MYPLCPETEPVSRPGVASALQWDWLVAVTCLYADSSVWVPGCSWGAPGTLLAHLLNLWWVSAVCHWAVLLSQGRDTTKPSQVKPSPASLSLPSSTPALQLMNPPPPPSPQSKGAKPSPKNKGPPCHRMKISPSTNTAVSPHPQILSSSPFDP